MTDTTSPNVRVVNDAYEAFSRGDIDAVVSAMDPDISWDEAEHSLWHAAGGHHGPSAVLANVFARIPDSFDAFEVDPSGFHDAGDVVIVEGRYRAKAANTGDLLTPRSATSGRSEPASSHPSGNTPTPGSSPGSPERNPARSLRP